MPLSWSDFPGTGFPGTGFPGTDFPGIDFPGTDFSGTDFPVTDCRAGNIFVVYSTTFPCLNRKKHCFLRNLRQACCSFFLCMVLPPVPCDISETPEWIFCNRRMDPVPCDISVTDALIYLRHQIKQNKPPQRCGGLKNRTTTFFDRDK